MILYDGRGIPEPIGYFFDYRNNYFRWDITYRSDKYGAPGFGNKWKAKIHIAADTPERLNSTYAVYPVVPENTADWGSEPNGIYSYWDPNQWYTVRVEWDNDNKDFSVYRDGVLMWESKLEEGVPITDNGVYPVTSPWPWLPVDLKIHLGSGPNRYSSKMPNVVYRNFQVVSTGSISNTAPVITSSAVTTGSVGQLYSYDVNASGNPTPTYSLTQNPSGMTIDPTSGLIQWTPSATGNVNVTVKASNGISPDATQSFTINVQSTNTPPIITSTAITNGTVGQLYSYDVNATGNPTPSYSLTLFPSGMTIDPTSGLIQWTPSATGNVNVTVKASNGINPDATQSFAINVQDNQTSTCPPSMISYWKLDETSGNTYADFIGTNNATSTNTPTPSTGRVNGGQTFNGTTNRITASRIAAYDFGASSSFTFEAWINHPTGTFADQDEIIVGRKTTESKLSVWLGFGVSSSVSFGVRSKIGEAKTVTGGPDLFDGNWHHVVGVKDGSLNELRIYVDGILRGTLAATYTSGFDSPTATMDIGWRNISWETAFFKGLIDEVAVYNSALDGASITQHYNNGLQNKGYCNDQTPGTAPLITSTAITNGTVGQLYSYDVNATGNPTPSYSLTLFPSGMTIDPTSGLIQWTPSATGNVNVTVKASNGINPDATQSFAINVQDNQTSTCPPSMISYWKLDETSGNTYADFIGTNNATSTNTPTPSTGRVNGGQTFNGTTNRITASRIAAYDFGASSSFTFEAWVNRPAGSYITEEIVVERKSSSSGLVVGLKFNYTRAISFSVRNTSWQAYSAAGSTLLYDGKWHHVVGVKDGNTNQLRLYVDGILEATVSASYAAGFDSPADGISIGWRGSSNEGFFKGLIDEVAVYNSALDGASITQHYNNGLQNKGYCNDQTPGTAPLITSTAITNGTVGQLYSYDVNATGNPTPSYSLTLFPSGMTIDPTSGLIQWTPSATGNVNVTVKASNGINPDATQSFAINVQDNQTSTCPPSMISYWKLDETSGNTYADFIGTNNATSTNTPTPSTGRVNGGQTFNGTTNRITAPRIAAYDFGASSSFTFEAWINHPTGTFADQDEIIVGRKTTESKLSVWLGFGVSSSVSFGVRSKIGEAKTVTGGPDLFDGNWHHVVGVKDGSLNELRIYVDGILRGTLAATYTSGFDSPTATMDIGWRNISWETAFFKGLIDEVAVYNSALDGASITQHYNNGLQNKGYCQSQLTFGKVNIDLTNIFTSIDNHVTGNTVRLNWETISELSDGKFEIERSIFSLTNSKDWQKIGEIDLLNRVESKSFIYNDNIIPSGKFLYRVKYVLGGVQIYSEQIETEVLPADYVLYQNYPNPFNPSTKIRFAIPLFTKVSLQIYNQIGEVVAQPVNNYYEAGNYEIDINMSNLASGVYLYKLSAGAFSETKKMMLTK